MKIFCSRQSNDVADYLGKDIWVKVDAYNDTYYMRFLRKVDKYDPKRPDAYDPIVDEFRLPHDVAYYVTYFIDAKLLDDSEWEMGRYDVDPRDVFQKYCVECDALSVSRDSDTFTTAEICDLFGWDKATLETYGINL